MACGSNNGHGPAATGQSLLRLAGLAGIGSVGGERYVGVGYFGGTGEIEVVSACKYTTTTPAHVVPTFRWA